MYKFALELLNKYLLNQWERIMKYFPFFTGLNIGMISLVFEKHVLRPYQIILKLNQTMCDIQNICFVICNI